MVTWRSAWLVKQSRWHGHSVPKFESVKSLVKPNGEFHWLWVYEWCTQMFTDQYQPAIGKLTLLLWQFHTHIHNRIPKKLRLPEILLHVYSQRLLEFANCSSLQSDWQKVRQNCTFLCVVPVTETVKGLWYHKLNTNSKWLLTGGSRGVCHMVSCLELFLNTPFTWLCLLNVLCALLTPPSAVLVAELYASSYDNVSRPCSTAAAGLQPETGYQPAG